MLVKLWRKGNPSALLVGMQTGAATVENSLEFPQKAKSGTDFWPSNSIAGIISKNPETTEIKGIPVHQQRNCRSRNQEKNPIWYSNKKNKILRNKLNWGSKRPVLRKLHNTEERKLRKTQINGRIYCAHGLEELTSIKYPYYPNQSTDSMQFLLKYQCPPSQN